MAWEIEAIEAGYFADEDGNVFSKKLNATSRAMSAKPRNKKSKYLSICVYVCGKSRTIYVHRLVYTFFNGTIPRDLEINHIDGNIANNSIQNLEAISPQKNKMHARVMGLLKPCRGEKQGSSKLKEIEVIAIKRLLNEGVGQTEIANIFNVSNHAIHKIKKGENWKHVVIDG